MVAMLLFAGVPLLHRLGPQVGPVATLVLFYLEAIAYTCLAGTGAGVQFYFLLGVALTMLYVGPEHIVVTTASAAVAAALIIVMQLTVPDDTGLLPWSLMVTALVTNAVVSCGTLLLIASYVLGEIARAETAAEREYERSERLLTNILPLPIAARLKNEGNVVIADGGEPAFRSASNNIWISASVAFGYRASQGQGCHVRPQAEAGCRNDPRRC